MLIFCYKLAQLWQKKKQSDDRMLETQEWDEVKSVKFPLKLRGNVIDRNSNKGLKKTTKHLKWSLIILVLTIQMIGGKDNRYYSGKKGLEVKIKRNLNKSFQNRN